MSGIEKPRVQRACVPFPPSPSLSLSCHDPYFCKFIAFCWGSRARSWGEGGGRLGDIIYYIAQKFVSKVVAHWPEACLKGRRTLNQQVEQPR